MEKSLKEDLLDFLDLVNNDFTPPLSDKTCLIEYVEKISKKSKLLIKKNECEIIGLVVLYCNDHISKHAYIPLVAVHPKHRGQGVAKTLMTMAIKEATANNMNTIRIHTNNPYALKLYMSLGFTTIEPGHRSYLEYSIN